MDRMPFRDTRKKRPSGGVGQRMTARPVLKPSALHPITITETPGRVTVRVGGEVIADTDAALTLQESNYAAVQYIPRADVNRDVLRPSDTTSYCPFKG